MSQNIKDGGPAFPIAEDRWLDPMHPNKGTTNFDGMTLRDYFAAKEVIAEGEITPALAKALMSSDIPESDGSNIQIIALYRWWVEAESRYRFMRADAMISAREVQS